MSFANAAKAAKVVVERAAPLVGTATVLAVQSPAQAREVQQASSALAQISRIQDEFEMVDFDGTKPIFRPVFSNEEITTAANDLRSLIEEPESETSEGSAADAIIEAAAPAFAQGARLATLHQADVDAAFSIATRLLSRPGVQREIAIAALTDPEVLRTLGAHPDPHGYLTSRGFAVSGLLPDAPANPDASLAPGVTITEVLEGAAAPEVAARGPAEEAKDPIAQLIDNVVKGLEWTGHRIADVAAWLRARLAPQEPEQEQEGDLDGKAAEGGAAPGARRGGGGGAAGLLDKAGKVAVVIVLLIVFRRAGLPFIR